ncbi:type I glutamate--ammonia ligase [Cuneatibacter caecimuris]|uniref:Glutamine synthetase n=1 Tax=Cuneatibacter caecimuris TaxID=1796618 RepID=A0A4Q7PJC9_9FIRM|nr:type I glutamate--ammonia ligase [Cuneatibacter caecimuris]RZT00556.1 glutamine synthetase [Cuneatibacter caecimuris]
MADYTRDDVLKMAEEEDVEFIRLQFTDMFGTLKNIAITAKELPKALNQECVVDCAFIPGVDGAEETDMYLYPDPNTFTILPWRPQQGKVARLICDIYRPDRTPYQLSSRYLLHRTAERAREQGYSFYVNPECEFFLFHTDDNGLPTTVSYEEAGYLDLGPLDFGENARRDMVLTLEDMGYEISSSHHETSPAQHEIDFNGDIAEKMADQIMTFKLAVRTVAKRHGLHATFMPKPRADGNGSGMHVNMSLFRYGKNIFADPGDPMGLSREAYYFIGGLLAHSREMAAVTNPLVNSYKRLVPGYEAPTEISWTKNNQTSLIRVPICRGEETKIELRSPDAAANPYLVFAACLAAGLDGIARKIQPEAVGGEENFPANLRDAVDELEKSEFMKQILGEEFFREYICAKRREWETYTRQVTEWELKEYLYRI